MIHVKTALISLVAAVTISVFAMLVWIGLEVFWLNRQVVSPVAPAGGLDGVYFEAAYFDVSVRAFAWLALLVFAMTFYWQTRRRSRRQLERD